jgi:tetratricopeptide (TPR) repeat protein
MTAVWRLLYRAWNEEDSATFASLIAETQRAALTEHDEMFCLYVRCLRGEFAAAAQLASERMPQAHTLMGYLGAAGAAMLALLFQGRLESALQIIRDARSVAQKNGHDPWLFVFREAWLRVLAFDFVGAGRLCETIEVGHPVLAVQPLTIARFANGYVLLDEGRYDDALRSFQQICDPEATPKFFLHWYWRLQSRLALTEIWLARGNRAKAQSAVAELLSGTLCIAEPTLRARALETAARVAMLSGNTEKASRYVAESLLILEQYQAPLAAWQVHATARDVYLRAGVGEAAANHWTRAQQSARVVADSLSVDPTLRSAFLAAGRIRQLEL